MDLDFLDRSGSKLKITSIFQCTRNLDRDCIPHRYFEVELQQPIDGFSCDSSNFLKNCILSRNLSCDKK
jgi:hypothetical protein